MPYIPNDDNAREEFDNALDNVSPMNVGELNYCITRMVLNYLEYSKGKLGYEKYNSVIGVLECAKLEMYRRRLAPYEDQKIAENGDVY